MELVLYKKIPDYTYQCDDFKNDMELNDNQFNREPAEIFENSDLDTMDLD